MDRTYAWLLAGHLIGVFFWIGGLISVYWLLRVHAHAPKDVHEKLTLMERSLALMMDLAATLAIGCGLGIAFKNHMFTGQKMGWFHVKLTVVVLGILSVHGIVRARLGKFGRGQISAIPQWLWSILIVSVVAIVILVTRLKFVF